MISGVWQSSAEAGLLQSRKDLHLWRIPLIWDEAALAAGWAFLSSSEHQKVARLRLARHRHQKAASYIALRSILARYLSVSPKEIRFAYGEHGKPRLENLPEGLSLSFNFSHSDGLACCAVASGVEVGVDVESVRAALRELDLAKRFFAPEEIEALEALPRLERRAMFYRYWTLKEAYIKAMGQGIALCPLSSFVVEPEASSWGGLRSVNGGAQAASGWRLANIDLGDSSCVGALALRGAIPRLTFLNYLPVSVDITC